MTVTDAAIAATTTQPRPRKPPRWLTRAGWLVVTAVVIAAFWHTEIRWARLQTFPQDLWHYLKLMFWFPDWNSFDDAFSATAQSVEMAWLGTILGIVVSFPLTFLAASTVAPLWVRWPMRAVFAVLRSVPEVVLAVIILSVTGLTPFTGALAIAVGSVGTLGKWGYEAMESVEQGPMIAVRAVGGSHLQVMRWGLWTTVAPEVFAFWLYRFEVNVRASAILGLIGAGGIGSMLTQNVQYRQWGVVGTLFIVVVIVTMIIDQISGAIRTKLVVGRWRA